MSGGSRNVKPVIKTALIAQPLIVEVGNFFKLNAELASLRSFCSSDIVVTKEKNGGFVFEMTTYNETSQSVLTHPRAVAMLFSE